MIIHRYNDGSEGYEYEVGDKVKVIHTISGGWFDRCGKGSKICKVDSIEKHGTWHTKEINIWFAKTWGTITCHPWGLEPRKQTIAKAKIVMEK